MEKIKIQLTMTDEEAWWLEQMLFSDCEEAPHFKFFLRIAAVVHRARERHPSQLAADPACTCPKLGEGEKLYPNNTCAGCI